MKELKLIFKRYFCLLIFRKLDCTHKYRADKINLFAVLMCFKVDELATINTHTL